MRYKVLLLVFTVVCASCAQRADINYRIVTGQPLQVMEHFGASDAWSMHVLGKWPEEKQKQIADWLFSTENRKAAGVDPATGEQLYWAWDTDENGVKGKKYITNDMAKATACKEIQGSRIPDLYGSINNTFKYKGFDLSILCTYSIGGKVLDGIYNTLLYGNYVGQAKSKMLERAWRNPGDITDIPRIEIGKSYIVTDNSLIDASYFAIKNIALGYSLPSKWMKSIGFDSARLTATADNVVLFNHLKGMNPQYNFTGGTDFGYVPVRTISFGIDITF